MNDAKLDAFLSTIGLLQSTQITLNLSKAYLWEKIQKMVLEKEKNDWGYLVSRYNLSIRKKTEQEWVLADRTKMSFLTTSNVNFVVLLSLSLLSETSNNCTVKINARVEYGWLLIIPILFIALVSCIVTLQFVGILGIVFMSILSCSIYFFKIETALANFIAALS